MHTKEALAALLSGRQYREEMTKVEEAQAKSAGLVVILGWSDDGVELRGAIEDDVGAYDGTTLRITPLGLLREWDTVDRDDEDVAEAYFTRKRAGFQEVEALWCAEGDYSWTFKTDIPHATFEIFDNGDPFCRGIVFELADVVPAEIAA